MTLPEIEYGVGLATKAATGLALAAVGECLAERAGVVNVSLEASAVLGALAGFTVGVATGSAAGGFWAAGAAGVGVAACFAALGRTRDGVLVGLCLNLLALGAASGLGRGLLTANGPRLGQLGSTMLRELPLVGPALSEATLPVWLLLFAAPFSTWMLFRTRTGLRLRACGANPAAALAAGVDVFRMRFAAVLVSGLGAGFLGGTAALWATPGWKDGLVAGQGYVALALAAVGRRNPLKTLGASLVYGAAAAIWLLSEASGDSFLPSTLAKALPFLAVLILTAVVSRRRA